MAPKRGGIQEGVVQGIKKAKLNSHNLCLCGYPNDSDKAYEAENFIK